MLTEREKREIQAHFTFYETKRAVCIEGLKIIQFHRRWVSDESVKDLAEFLDMSPEEIEGVATFYNLIFRKPVGRHVVHVCESVSCWIMGAERVKTALCRKLGVRMGETASDGSVTLLAVPCLGACDKAPAALFDGELRTCIELEKPEESLWQSVRAKDL